MKKIVDGVEIELTDSEIAAIEVQQDLDSRQSTPAPSSASKLGIVRALRESGAWASIKTVIAADETMQEDWDAAQEIRRTDPLVVAMIAHLGLTDAHVDALMIRAAELVA